MVSSGSSTVDFAFVFRINGLTVNRSLCRTNLPAQDFDSKSEQRRQLAAFAQISFPGMNARRLKDILARAKSKRILVIGDLMLDEFVWGKVGRISPEAPVPVVEVTGESSYPGGAANVARNLREFTGSVAVIGTVGTDENGRQLLELLREQKIQTDLVLEDPEFPTIVKTRIVARHQQVVRVDRETIQGPTNGQVVNIAAGVRDALPQLDAFIFEDYGKGFLSPGLVTQISADLSAGGKIITADPNPQRAIDWGSVTAIKPNRAEALQAAGLPVSDPIDPPS